MHPEEAPEFRGLKNLGAAMTIYNVVGTQQSGEPDPRNKTEV
jgi:hypothetical protein